MDGEDTHDTAGGGEHGGARREATGFADALADRLRGLGSPERAANERRYLRSELHFLGVPVPVVRAETRRLLRAHPDLDHDTLLDVVAELWSRPTHELRRGAVECLVARVRLLTPRDLAPVERMVRTAGTWAYVDNLADNVAGHVLLRHPEAAETLDRWATDDDFWVRRAALLALLPSVRANDTARGWACRRFSRYAEGMLAEREFFVRKAIGWVLREIARRDPAWTAAWVDRRVDRLSGVTLREAVRHLDPAERERLLARHRRQG